MLKLEILDCRPVTLEKKGQLCKSYFGIFEILEHPFLSDYFQKSICGGVFFLLLESPCLASNNNQISTLKSFLWYYHEQKEVPTSFLTGDSLIWIKVWNVNKVKNETSACKADLASRASFHRITLQGFIFKNFPAGGMRLEGVPPVTEKFLIITQTEKIYYPSPNFPLTY